MNEPSTRMRGAQGLARPPSEVDERLEADQRLRRVKAYLENDVSRNLTLAKAAEIAQLATTYFSDYFRRKIGVRFKQWVHEVRIRHAVELLRTTDLPIREVSSAVGYRGFRTFERAFRSRMRMSAREWMGEVRPAVAEIADAVELRGRVARVSTQAAMTTRDLQRTDRDLDNVARSSSHRESDHVSRHRSTLPGSRDFPATEENVASQSRERLNRSCPETTKSGEKLFRVRRPRDDRGGVPTG